MPPLPDTIPTNTTLCFVHAARQLDLQHHRAGGTGTFTCTLNASQTIAVGASVSFPLVVKRNPTLRLPAPSLTNHKFCRRQHRWRSDFRQTIQQASTTVVAAPTQSDVSIVKTASPEPVNQGTNLTYTLDGNKRRPCHRAGSESH